jgi:hypothetical protein
MLQLGSTAAAFSTLVCARLPQSISTKSDSALQALATHTFCAVWWNKGEKALRTALIVTAMQWLFTALFVGIAIGTHPSSDVYIGPTPVCGCLFVSHYVSITFTLQFWCWIGPNYPMQRIFGQYLWYWVTLIFSLLSYIPLYFCYRGCIAADEDIWWKVRIPGADKGGLNPSRKWALGLIWYVCNPGVVATHIAQNLHLTSTATLWATLFSLFRSASSDGERSAVSLLATPRRSS